MHVSHKMHVFPVSVYGVTTRDDEYHVNANVYAFLPALAVALRVLAALMCKHEHVFVFPAALVCAYLVLLLFSHHYSIFLVVHVLW